MADKTACQYSRWIYIEFSILIIATPLFLIFVPKHMILYATLAALFLLYIVITARNTERVVWQFRAAKPKRAWVQVLVWTLPIFLLFIGLTWLQRAFVWSPNIVIVFLGYCIWAIMQQCLFQFYFLGRLIFVLPDTTPGWLLYGFNGIAYGLVHAPDWSLVMLTMPAGFLWSMNYIQNRAILPLAFSHALLATAYYTIWQGVNPFLRWLS